jgi:putative permease
MFDVIKAWFFKYFSDPEAAILILTLFFGIGIIWVFGTILSPLLAGLVFAYLLDGLVVNLQRRLHCPRVLALTIVYTLFIGLFAYLIIGLIPTLYKQLMQFSTQIPTFMTQFHAFLLALPVHYPGLISQSMVQTWITSTNINPEALASFGSNLLSNGMASLPFIMSAIVSVFLIPLITFFLLKDKVNLMKGFNEYMPDQKGLIIEVAGEMRVMIGRYVRGKVFEVILVTLITWIAFYFLHLNYAFLLAALVGLSAIIPYVGAIVVTLPVVAVAMMQWGTGAPFCYTLIVYALIQILDGNILVPILYAEAVNLNPVVIITAVLFFGGIWGFWGLFFAIPLATLVKAVVKAWIRHADATYQDKLAKRAQQALPF